MTMAYTRNPPRTRTDNFPLMEFWLKYGSTGQYPVFIVGKGSTNNGATGTRIARVRDVVNYDKWYKEIGTVEGTAKIRTVGNHVLIDNRDKPSGAGGYDLTDQIRKLNPANGLFGGAVCRVDAASDVRSSLFQIVDPAGQSFFNLNSRYDNETRMRVSGYRQSNADPAWEAMTSTNVSLTVPQAFHWTIDYSGAGTAFLQSERGAGASGTGPIGGTSDALPDFSTARGIFMGYSSFYGQVELLAIRSGQPGADEKAAFRAMIKAMADDWAAVDA